MKKVVAGYGPLFCGWRLVIHQLIDFQLPLVAYRRRLRHRKSNEDAGQVDKILYLLLGELRLCIALAYGMAKVIRVFDIVSQQYFVLHVANFTKKRIAVEPTRKKEHSN